jgi:hypothetical protein
MAREHAEQGDQIFAIERRLSAATRRDATAAEIQVKDAVDRLRVGESIDVQRDMEAALIMMRFRRARWQMPALGVSSLRWVHAEWKRAQESVACPPTTALKAVIIHIHLVDNVCSTLVARVDAALCTRSRWGIVAVTGASGILIPVLRPAGAVDGLSNGEANTRAERLAEQICLRICLVHAKLAMNDLSYSGEHD